MAQSAEDITATADTTGAPTNAHDDGAHEVTQSGPLQAVPGTSNPPTPPEGALGTGCAVSTVGVCPRRAPGPTVMREQPVPNNEQHGTCPNPSRKATVHY